MNFQSSAREITIAIFIMLCPSFATPATADWSFTRWGMTPAEVSKAVAHQQNFSGLHAHATGPTVSMLYGEYAVDEMSFSISFVFAETGLIAVTLHSEDNDAAEAYAWLVDRYGPSPSKRHEPDPNGCSIRTARWVRGLDGKVLFDEIICPRSSGAAHSVSITFAARSAPI